LPALAEGIAESEGGATQAGFPVGPGSIADIDTEDWGWYPRGGGVVRATIKGNVCLRGLTCMERGSLRSVSALSAASNLPDHVRQRQANRADFLLRKRGIKPRIEIVSPPSPGQGTVVFILAEYQRARGGFTSYGRLRKPAEKVAEEACKAFSRYHKRGQPVDAHLADQLLLPLAFSRARTQYAVESITRHLLTNVWVIQQLLKGVRVGVDGEEGRPGVVTIDT
jgi:RNA 3'-terminal phosphate cyclase (ATP)